MRRARVDDRLHAQFLLIHDQAEIAGLEQGPQVLDDVIARLVRFCGLPGEANEQSIDGADGIALDDRQTWSGPRAVEAERGDGVLDSVDLVLDLVDGEVEPFFLPLNQPEEW